MIITVLGVPLNGWAALSLTVQFLLPLLVGLVTNKETNRERQFLILAGLTLVATVLTQVVQLHDSGQPVTQVVLVQVVVSSAVNLVISLLSHYGVWKPTNITSLMLALFSKNDPAPLPPATPAQAPATATLPARHLYVAPTFREAATAAGDGKKEAV